jgi:AraC-like DNA-binding protein
MSKELSLLSAPYHALRPYSPDLTSSAPCEDLRGAVLIWSVIPEHLESGTRVAASRPRGVALVIVLPPAAGHQVDSLRMSQALEVVRPNSVLPYHPRRDAERFVLLLRRAPDDLRSEFLDFLSWRGVSLDRETRRVVGRIIEVAPRIATLEALARNLYLSRRALGRRFQRLGLPVPSHWLQIARLLWACVRLQSSETTLAQVSASLGYPDSFTLSNQMLRMTGVRPSLARERLGWEWLVEEWLVRENNGQLVSAPVTYSPIDSRQTAATTYGRSAGRAEQAHLGSSLD